MTAQALVYLVSAAHRFNIMPSQEDGQRYAEPTWLTTHVCLHGMHLALDRYTKVLDGQVISLLPGKRPGAHLTPCDGSCRARSFLSTFGRSLLRGHEDEFPPPISWSWMDFREDLRCAYRFEAKTYGRVYYSESGHNGRRASWCFGAYHLDVDSDPDGTRVSSPWRCDDIACRHRHLTLPKSMAQRARKAAQHSPSRPD